MLSADVQRWINVDTCDPDDLMRGHQSMRIAASLSQALNNSEHGCE